MKAHNRPKRWIKRTFLSLLALALLATVGFYLRPVSYLNEWTYVNEDLSGVQSRNMQVAGHHVHYLAEGPANGPVVVLVHGLGGSAEDWRNLAPYLAQSGFRVYIPDLLGYGRSEQPADFSYSVRDEAAVVVGFMDALGLKQVQLGGWSMGGWIAVLVAAQHPERISRLMLFDAVGLNVPPTFDTALFTPPPSTSSTSWKPCSRRSLSPSPPSSLATFCATSVAMAGSCSALSPPCSPRRT